MCADSHISKWHFYLLTKARDTEGTATLVLGECLMEHSPETGLSPDDSSCRGSRGLAVLCPPLASLEPRQGLVTDSS